MNIKIGNNLDEKEFFRLYTTIVNNIKDTEPNEKVILDITKCSWIGNVVVPDILVLGEILKQHYKRRLSLFLPKHGNETQRIKSYLNDIRLVDIAEWEDNVDVDYIAYDRYEKVNRILPDYCLTSSYKIETQNMPDKRRKEKEEEIINLIKQDVLNKYMELFQKYLSQFFYIKKIDGENVVFNVIQTFIIQISVNAIVHGQRKVFVTMQANMKDKLCTVSVSDNGIGITEGIRAKYEKGIKMSLVAKDTFEKHDPYHQDILAAIEALAYRYNDKIYGLYSVFLQVMDEGGEIHLHTNNALLLIKEECKRYIESARNKDDFALGLYNYFRSCEDRVVKTECFFGTHMKLLIPIKEGI